MMHGVENHDRREHVNNDDKDPQVCEPRHAALQEQLNDILVPREPIR